MIFSWSLLPDIIGVHFDNKGYFDIYVSKNNIFCVIYPYLISFIIMLFSCIIIYYVRKIKIGFKVNKIGEEKIRILIELVINMQQLLWVFFLSIIWSNSIIRQISLNTIIPVVMLILLGILIIILMILIIRIRYKDFLVGGLYE